MSRFLVLVFLITASTFYFVEANPVTNDDVETAGVSTLDCGSNEVQIDCPTECLNDKCAKSEADAKTESCPPPEVCPAPICQCRLNYRRVENGSCVPIEECPRFPCKKNEEYLTSPPFCSDDCQFATEDGTCHIVGKIGIILIKRQVCRCKKNYWRLDGVCVPYSFCKFNPDSNLEDMPQVIRGPPKTLPVVPPKSASPKTASEIKTQTLTIATTEKPELNCPEDEVQDDCPADSASEYCPRDEKEAKRVKNLKKPEVCPPPKCVCGFNQLRAKNGTCINIRDCPPFDCCSGPFQQYNPCPSYCPGEDCKNATPDGKCPAIFGHLPVLACYPSCHCIDNYYRKNGICVPYAECGKN